MLVIYLGIISQIPNFSSEALQTAEILIILLVTFFATREAVAPLSKYPVMLGRSTWLFRHPELQNPSIIDAKAYPSRIRKNVIGREQRTDNG